MMNCVKKQIQRKQQTNNSKKYSFTQKYTNSYSNGTKQHQKNKKSQLQQRSYKIDGWNSTANIKYQQTASNRLNYSLPNKKCHFNDKHLSKQSGLQFYMKKQNPLSLNGNRIISQNARSYSRQFTQLQTNMPMIESIGSPTKQNMMECSFKFQQYELHKAAQLNKAFYNNLRQNQQKLTPSSTTPKPKTNFIERNKQYVFQMENFLNVNQMERKKNKTIEEQAKEKLLLKNQKLIQESKEISKFIPMKEEKKNKKKTEQEIGKPVASVWCLGYLQTKKSVQKHKKKIKYLNYDKFKSQFNQFGVNEYFHEFKNNSVVSALDQKKSQIQREQYSQTENRAGRENKHVNSLIYSKKNDSKHQNESNPINKFNRMLKLKNKSIKMISNSRRSDQKRQRAKSELKNNKNRTSDTLNKISQNRIHSFERKYLIKQSTNNPQNQSHYRTILQNVSCLFQSSNTKNPSSPAQKYDMSFDKKQRSLSACAGRKTVTRFKQMLGQKLQKSNYKNQMFKKLLYIEGNQYEINKIEYQTYLNR